MTHFFLAMILVLTFFAPLPDSFRQGDMPTINPAELSFTE